MAIKTTWGNMLYNSILPLLRVGVRRLELPASTSRTWRANQLCYTPNLLKAVQRYCKSSEVPNFSQAECKKSLLFLPRRRKIT